jgi:hypothetical protein
VSKFSEIKARVDALRGVKHTPGPWIGRNANVDAADGTGIVSAFPYVRSISEINANIRLIAAASEAVADCGELLAIVDDMQKALREIAAHRCAKADDCVCCIAAAALDKVQS